VMSRCQSLGQRRLGGVKSCERSGHGLPLCHRLETMDVGGEGCAFVMRRNEEISDCRLYRYEALQASR
jgi:hypothetical protein